MAVLEAPAPFLRAARTHEGASDGDAAIVSAPRLGAPLLLLLALGCEGTLGSGGDAGWIGDAATTADAGPLDASDGETADGGMPDGGAPDGGPGDAGSFTPPSEVFFVGNSFTFGGDVPGLVRDLALYAGFPEPNVERRAIGGQTLEGHRADTSPEGAPARVAEGWDVVVLQELSTRPTDQIGPAERFKEDATWFYDLAKSASPECEVILYETWARRAGHSLYASTFEGPAQMQAELRFHYRDAAERYIPMFATAARSADVRVAPAGDAWELQLAGGEPPRLHASDDYHASAAGAYLNALVIYSTIYHRRADGLIPLGVDEATAAELQASADAVTGAEGYGAVFERPRAIAAGSVVRVDVGPLWVDGWTPLDPLRGTVGPIATTEGRATSVIATAWGFSGRQEGGLAENTLGLPGDVSRDSLWVGTFDGHAAALGMEARVVLRGLDGGPHRIELFASRSGTDEGRGRLTRYRIGSETRDLDVADNTSRMALFEAITPDARGEVVIRIGVSPAGAARFAYLGALRITRE